MVSRDSSEPISVATLGKPTRALAILGVRLAVSAYAIQTYIVFDCSADLAVLGQRNAGPSRNLSLACFQCLDPANSASVLYWDASAALWHLHFSGRMLFAGVPVACGCQVMVSRCGGGLLSVSWCPAHGSGWCFGVPCQVPQWSLGGVLLSSNV